MLMCFVNNPPSWSFIRLHYWFFFLPILIMKYFLFIKHKSFPVFETHSFFPFFIFPRYFQKAPQAMIRNACKELKFWLRKCYLKKQLSKNIIIISTVLLSNKIAVYLFLRRVYSKMVLLLHDNLRGTKTLHLYIIPLIEQTTWQGDKHWVEGHRRTN